MDDEDGVSGIGDGVVDGVEQSAVLVDLAEQQRPGVGSEPSALKVGNDGLGPESGKKEWHWVTVRHGGGLGY
jgi:hypothetical protein